MATYKGSTGVIKVGSSPEATIAEITSFSVELTGDTVEDTQLTDTERTYLSNKSSWTVSIEAHYDPTDTAGQEALDVLSTVSLIMFPTGESASPATSKLTGSAIITAKSIANADGATVTVSISAQGTGALTGI